MIVYRKLRTNAKFLFPNKLLAPHIAGVLYTLLLLLFIFRKFNIFVTSTSQITQQ